MNKAIEFLKDELIGLYRVGVTSGLVETTRINYFDQPVLIKYIAQVAPHSGGIAVLPHNPNDRGMIAKALNDAGFQAYPFSKTEVLVCVPKWTNSGDQEHAVTHVKKLGEEAKIVIRNIRKQARKSLEKTELDKIDKELQKLTDESIRKIDVLIENKIKLLME